MPDEGQTWRMPKLRTACLKKGELSRPRHGQPVLVTRARAPETLHMVLRWPIGTRNSVFFPL